MSKPDFVVRLTDRTPAGYLKTRTAQLISGKLSRGGFAILPSDTCYSLAAMAVRRDTFRNVNKILGRGVEPISLAFSSYLEVQKYVTLELGARLILETFSPGPVTVVCTAHTREADGGAVIPDDFFTSVIGTSDRTIGVRIPDSLIERDIVATSGYPITSVAIRDPLVHEPVRDFQQACRIVEEGILQFGAVGWIAVEGEFHYEKNSTVVAINQGVLRNIRDGMIPFSDIEALMANIPVSTTEDWA